MTYIEERLTAIANALETHSELLAERRNIASASVSIGKAAEELRKLAKQHSEQIADMSELCLTVEEANELKAQAVIGAIDAHKNNLLTFDFNTAIRVTDLIKYANQLRRRLDNARI